MVQIPPAMGILGPNGLSHKRKSRVLNMRLLAFPGLVGVIKGAEPKFHSFDFEVGEVDVVTFVCNFEIGNRRITDLMMQARYS